MLQTIRPYRTLLLLAGIGLAMVALATTLAYRVARQQAVVTTERAATQLAQGNAGLLASELQKFRLLPLVLAEYPDVRTMLESGDPRAVERVNARLELLARRTDAAVIYVIAPDGRTRAASNHRLPTSFIGQDYGFRPYFREALRDGGAELFALGTVSGRPGLYIARRIGDSIAPLGVIVVKIEFEALQGAWARQQGDTIVTDRHGVVIITSRPQWRFRTLAEPGRAARAAIRATRQYGDLPLDPLPFVIDDATATGRDKGPGSRVAVASLPLEGAQLRTLIPLGPAIRSANANARLIALAALAVIAGLLVLVWRERERRGLQRAARRALETEVAARTAELRETNRQLIAESAERALADRRFREAREELAQANRLGSLGQITAGVAHEINQPVAAIRSFAENARQFLKRDAASRVDENLARIVDLTQRIGTITGELRDFARRRTPQVGAVAVDAMLDSALLLIGDRIRANGVALERRSAPGLAVIADRVRLEQILINLIQNALDAMEGRAAPTIRIEAEQSDDIVRIIVSDNGPGIPDALLDQIFQPFVTGREQGLGLGLAIARNIARDFGGELEHAPSSLGGAAFNIILKRAVSDDV